MLKTYEISAYKIGNIINIYGVVNPLNPGTAVNAIFSIPEEYAPAEETRFPATAYSAPTGNGRIRTNGVAYFDFSEANKNYAFNFSYPLVK